jgi:CHASE2 domain-containing sensor protein
MPEWKSNLVAIRTWLAASLKHQIAEPESLLRETLRALPVVVGVTSLVVLLEWLTWLDGLENYALDRILRTNWSRQSDQIVLISIGEKDYESPEFFRATSPLDPAKIREAIEFVAKANPAVIGVDLDTAAKGYSEPPISTHGVRIVWGRPATVAKENENTQLPFGHGFSFTVAPGDFVGGKSSETISGDLVETIPRSGVAIMPSDADHVLRRYLRTVELSRGNGPSQESKALEGASDVRRVDSLPWAIVKEYCDYCLHSPGNTRTIEPERAQAILDESNESHGESHGRVFNFSYNPRRFRQIDFSDFVRQQRAGQWPATGSPLDGRIVLLGGEYAAARDVHFTPVGERFGLELVAEAVDGEIEGRFASHFAKPIEILLDLTAGIALVWMHWWLRRGWAIYATAVLIFAVSVVCSIIAFRSAAYWFNFTAVLVGVWIHLLWHGSITKRKTQKELDRYRERFGPLAEA